MAHKKDVSSSPPNALESSGAPLPLEFDPEFLRELAHARMPFGKYQGRRLLHLPEAYIIWFREKGLPPGKLGKQLATVYEIKLNGLEYLFRDLSKFE